jgi:hypothetical protein
VLKPRLSSTVFTRLIIYSADNGFYCRFLQMRWRPS